METSLIEQLDKSRYSLIKWLTAGWTVWFGSFIIKDLIDSKVIVGTMLVAGLIAWVLFTISLVKFLLLGKKIRSDGKLKNALNNEWHQLLRYKTSFWGFLTVIATISIFLVISLFHELPALIVCEVTLFLGILSALIAGLLYNRG
jgi:hypothetical protein